MDVLSHADGSAQAVREAAGAGSNESRLALERELDRLNAGLHAHATGLAQHLNWMLLAQSFLLTAYLVVLVAGWSVPLPGKRALLAAIAAYGVASLILGNLALKGSRDRIAPLRQSRRVIEQALERVAARPPVFSREPVFVASLGPWSSRLLSLIILSGWASLTLYTLALPLPAENRPVAARDSRLDARPAAMAPAEAAPVAARRAAPSVRKSSGEPAAAVSPVAPFVPAPPEAQASTPGSESGLAALFRRAITAPPAETVAAEKP
jgi:hypothetical protein